MKLRSMKSAKVCGTGNQQIVSNKTAEEPVQNRDYYLVESKLLHGEVIILCKVKSALRYLREKYPGTVIYFPPEIFELERVKNDQDAIRKIHLVKKKFHGWIIPNPNYRGDTQ